MGKWCLHASSFIFDQIVIKVAGNQDRHKSSDEFVFGPLVSMTHLYVFWNEIWPWHIGLRWAIVALWATCCSGVTLSVVACDHCYGITMSVVACSHCNGITMSVVACDHCCGITMSLVAYGHCCGITMSLVACDHCSGVTMSVVVCDHCCGITMSVVACWLVGCVEA